MMFIKYKNHEFSYVNGKFNLNEILGILDYNKQEKNLWVNKTELFEYLNEKDNDDIEFVNFINKDFVNYVPKNLQKKRYGWIYIASNDIYQEYKIYKIGYTKNLYKQYKLFSNNSEQNFYFIKVFKTHFNYEDVFNYIKSLLKDFSYKIDSDLFIGIHIYDLIDIVEFLVRNHSSEETYKAKLVKDTLEKSNVKKKMIMKPLYIKSIFYVIENEKEEICIDKKNKNVIQENFFNLLNMI